MNISTFSTDFNDAASTAVAALELGRKVAPLLTSDLPALLGQHGPGGLRLLADRVQTRDVFEQFSRQTLDSVILQCDGAIARGTRLVTDWVEVRHIGGDAEYEPREIQVLTDQAMEINRIRQQLVELCRLVDRTHDLAQAQDIVSGLRR